MRFLFDVFGIGWVAILIIISLRILDRVTGRPIEAILYNILDFDYYPSLIWKYRDKDRLKYQEQRAWAYNNYKEYLPRAIREQNRTTWWLMIRAKAKYDYKTLYNIMQDLDEPMLSDNEIAEQIK